MNRFSLPPSFFLIFYPLFTPVTVVISRKEDAYIHKTNNVRCASGPVRIIAFRSIFRIISSVLHWKKKIDSNFMLSFDFSFWTPMSDYTPFLAFLFSLCPREIKVDWRDGQGNNSIFCGLSLSFVRRQTSESEHAPFTSQKFCIPPIRYTFLIDSRMIFPFYFLM